MRTAVDKDWSSPVVVREQVGPRSFTVGDNRTSLVGNRRHLYGPLPQCKFSKVAVSYSRNRNEIRNEPMVGRDEPKVGRDMITTRRGRISKQPDRYGVTRR